METSIFDEVDDYSVDHCWYVAQEEKNPTKQKNWVHEILKKLTSVSPFNLLTRIFLHQFIKCTL